jgi:hypothetical protein
MVQNSNSKALVQKLVKQMFEKWKELDKPRSPTLEEISFFHHVDDIVRKEAGIAEGEVKVLKTLERRERRRQDLGHFILGDTVVLKVNITDHYGGAKKTLESIAYYQVLPIMEIHTPIARLLEWRATHQPSWVVWFTSPIAEGFRTRTEGEYIVAHTLSEKETSDQRLLRKLGRFPCIIKSHGMNILLSFESLAHAVVMVEQFLPILIKRNLYGDSSFLEFLDSYREKLILPLLIFKR